MRLASSRAIGWGTMTVFALIIAAYAAAVASLPAFGPPFIHQRRIETPIAVLLHLGGGALALGLGPWQFNRRIRTRAVNVHHWIGRLYVTSVGVSGVAALTLAPRSQHGLVSHLGFGALAVLWLFATGQAYLRIRAGDVAAHQRWMTRSYALTLAAVTLRIYLPLSLIAGIPSPDAYQAVAWLCWVPNLIVAEWWFVSRMPPVDA